MSISFTDFIFISSEDDKYTVKGGIGIYLGLLTKTLSNIRPNAKILWITESPTNNEFNEIEENLTRMYIPKGIFGGLTYSENIKIRIEKYIDARMVKEKAKCFFFIEAPEWEGLLQILYSKVNLPNILKVTRVHTPLAACIELNSALITDLEVVQMENEKKQILSSDFLSYPTEYIKEVVIRKIFNNIPPPIDSCVLPNCLNTLMFPGSKSNREDSIKIFRKYSSNIETGHFNVFIMGSLEKRKGTDLAIKIANRVLSTYPNMHFYFIGHYFEEDKGNLTANSKFSITELRKVYSPNIHFVGYIDHINLPAIMQAGDLFFICYLGDNFPNTVGEIGLSKRPLIALLRGGLIEMIKTDTGYAAITFEGEFEDEIVQRGYEKIIDFYKGNIGGNELTEMLYRKLLTYNEHHICILLMTKYEEILKKKAYEYYCR